MKKIAEVMTKDVVTIDKDATVKEASKILTENGLNGAPVVDGDKMIGVISGGDLMSRPKKKRVSNFMNFLDNVFYMEDYEDFENEFKDILDTEIRKIMTKDVITLSPEDSVRHAANMFLEKGIKQIPIVKEEKLVGIIEMSNLISALSEDEE